MRRSRKPPLTEGEQVILCEQGGYLSNLRTGWKLGHHYLTNKRLFFSQAMRVVFETPLACITDVTAEERAFVLGRKNVICISYRRPKVEGTSKARIIMASLETWRKKIYEMIVPPINEETVNEVTEELDSVDQEILWYLWQNGHGTINELAELVSAPTHMDILLRIREVINPTAERIIGNPILSFEKSKIDSETGEKILFSWWLIGREQLGERRKEVLLDIFDEGDYIDVVMELLGVQEEDILLKMEKDKLTVFANTPNNEYREEILLPREIDAENLTKKYNNNILKIRLKKLRGRGLKTAGQDERERQ
ncbi:Hsp20/alpha crystallin family protein [Candidatus Oleimmundimicrobium sp.]|uniref:Hsp20/alpha crystallin family protein n=1 Tax=Candidatus Oleimmundimicrobium sp. TaxID=3060597 RepID=UPI0027172BF6|nr:Hsp20/alpha crystallin family protein [Candidatus Oleimmundimicrobium sp.]MDO8885538.1 Hsp20/alpha crystallin family protein [Candidatus Oleimmundimicrobium sp.]